MNYDKMSRVSMNGRMAYVIMCVEAFLKTKYHDRDWSLIAEKMWLATKDNWTDWPLMFASFIPDVLVDYDEYDEGELNGMTAEEFSKVKSLYNGITEGIEDDPDDDRRDRKFGFERKKERSADAGIFSFARSDDVVGRIFER